MSYKSLFSSKLAIILLIVLLGFLANLKYKQWKNQKAIEKEEQSLSQQADSLEKKNNDLNQSLSYITSGSFKERVARQQLGLKKEGEQVFDFSEAVLAPAKPDGSQDSAKVSNAQKWLKYFTQSP